MLPMEEEQSRKEITSRLLLPGGLATGQNEREADIRCGVGVHLMKRC